ncbi:hypothetical protein EDC22_102170 [Tepidamorphus gemmatus]|uniref:Uncharacterized protein n=1 Tax=Tepidamorphus gemmatus TaxID=747076 RepID=A0A4R3MFJ4_9HYPH|nr:hypothetical protein EDC22_102170 [Tepidamorphus gemmatus]
MLGPTCPHGGDAPLPMHAAMRAADRHGGPALACAALAAGDIRQGPEAFAVAAALPGVRPDDIEVTCDSRLPRIGGRGQRMRPDGSTLLMPSLARAIPGAPSGLPETSNLTGSTSRCVTVSLP